MGTSNKSKAASGKARHEKRTPDDADTTDPFPETEGERAIDSSRILDYPDLDRTRMAERIEPDEVNGWARQLGVSPERLREAIRMAGDALEDVRRYLTKPH